mgnify:CR=1 FL=1
MTTSSTSGGPAIASYLKSMSSPLHLLRIINLVPVKSWWIEVSVDRELSPKVWIQCPEQLAVDPVQENLMPEVWFGSPTFDKETRTLEIEAFADRKLGSEWSNVDKIADLLSRETWLGGYAFRESNAYLKLSVLGTDWIFTPGMCTRLGRDGEHVKLSIKGLSINVVAIPGMRTVTVRDAVYGDRTPDPLRTLVEQLRPMGVRSGLVEFGPGWLEPAPMGLVQLTTTAKEVLDQTLDLKDCQPALKDFLERARKQALQRSAAKLNLRKMEALSADQIFFGEKFVGTVPTSEYGTVALIHKLEALGAFPVAGFKTHAWAGSDGVDALGDYQIDTMHAVHHNIAIEYEFHFSSFLAHQHPHEHVGLVVCWDLDSPTLQKTHEPWLHYIDDGEHRIPVLTISDFPQLEIRKVSPQ